MEFLRKSKIIKPVMFIAAGFAAVGVVAPMAINGINERSMNQAFQEVVDERQDAFDSYNAAFAEYEAEVNAAFDDANLLGADHPLVEELTSLFSENEDGELEMEAKLTIDDPPEQEHSHGMASLQMDVMRDEARQLGAAEAQIEDLTGQVEDVHARLLEEVGS